VLPSDLKVHVLFEDEQWREARVESIILNEVRSVFTLCPERFLIIAYFV